MKLLILLLPLISFGQFQKQNYFFLSTEVDPKNAMYGSEVNEPGLDLVFNLGYRNRGINFQIAYESFRAISFESLELKGGYVFNNTRKLQYGALFGLGFIFREVDWTRAMNCSLSLSGLLEYHFADFFVGLRPEIRYRGDLAHAYSVEHPQQFVYSNYIKIGYKF